jgi:hypothetical protein
VDLLPAVRHDRRHLRLLIGRKIQPLAEHFHAMRPPVVLRAALVLLRLRKREAGRTNACKYE